MPRRKTILTTRSTSLGRNRRQRIHIPQSPYRGTKILGRDNLKRIVKRPDYWWFTEHRRGVRRPLIGIDPLEARAVSKSSIHGTLPERIVYRFLTASLRMIPNVDFDFQSSLQGGRLEIGGIVADFLFPYLRIIIQVQGPTHGEFLRGRKDEEQKDILVDLGFTVFDLDEQLIYNELAFDTRMRQIFGLLWRSGSGRITDGSPGGITEEEDRYRDEYVLDILDDVVLIHRRTGEIKGIFV